MIKNIELRRQNEINDIIVEIDDKFNGGLEFERKIKLGESSFLSRIQHDLTKHFFHLVFVKIKLIGDANGFDFIL